MRLPLGWRDPGGKDDGVLYVFSIMYYVFILPASDLRHLRSERGG